MIEITCPCGGALTRGENEINSGAACPSCAAVTLYVCGEELPSGAGAGDFDIALVIVGGPARLGQQVALGGVAELTLGKGDGRSIQLLGHQISRHHATLTRVDFGPGRWSVRDNRSTNGLFVNGERVSERELAIGDRVTLGDFELEVRDASPQPVAAGVAKAKHGGVAAALASDDGDLLDFVEEPVARPTVRARPTLPEPDPTGPATKTCPRCKKSWPRKAKFCTDCGVDLSTGKRAVLTKDIDEDALYVRAENAIRIVSWVLPFGLLPIGSDALGARKPTATWIITGVTALCSVLFMIAMHTNDRAASSADDEEDVALVEDAQSAGPSAGVQNLMLWSGDREAEARERADAVREMRAELDPVLRATIKSSHPKWTAAQVDAELAAMHARTDASAKAASSPEVGFRWYQLVTHAFLHDFSGWIGLILHFGGNLLFLLVFGLRVNELIGQWRFVVSYLLLAVGAGLTQQVLSADGPMIPSVGASGAIMGLAGMYLVLFPRQNVWMTIWMRFGLLSGFRLAFKIWRMPGFWLLVAWVAWNDVLPVALRHALHIRSQGGVAHWAHLGGFVCGVALALVWLLTKQVHAHGHDLISNLFGPRAAGLVRQG